MDIPKIRIINKPIEDTIGVIKRYLRNINEDNVVIEIKGVKR